MPKQAWVSDILKAPTEQTTEEPKQSNKAWVSDILATPPKEVEEPKSTKAKSPPPPAIPTPTPTPPKATEPVSLNPAKIISGLVKKFTAPSANKREAGYLDLLAAGAEQGVVPFLPQAAVKGSIGAAKSGQGALAKTAGGIEAVFDPNVTGYARTTGAQFPEHMTMPQEAALIGGNVLGTIAKAVASGGTGLADTAAKLGALGIAKQIGKRAGYETAKQGLGVGAGMGSAMAANKALQMTPIYKDASPEEQQQMSTIASAAGGIGGGISADRLASLGIRNIKPLAQARDLMVKGSEIPTYAEAERAKGIKEATDTEPAQEILNTTEPKVQEPVEQAATAEAVNKGGVYPSEVTDIEAQTLSNIRKSHSKIAKATFKAEDAIVKPYENTTLREPSKVADQDFSNAVKNIQNVAKTEAIPEQPVKLTDYEPAGYSQLSSGHRVEFSGTGDTAKGKFVGIGNTTAAVENGTAATDIQSLIHAHNDIIGSEGGSKNKQQVMVDTLQNYLDDVGSSAGKTPEEKTGIIKGLLQDSGLSDKAVDRLVSENGTVSANDVINAYNRAGLTGDATAIRSGRDMATEYMLHAEPKGLTENDAKYFYDQLVGKQGREEAGVNMHNASQQMSADKSLEGAQKTLSALNEFVSPNGDTKINTTTPELSAAYAKMSDSLGLPPKSVEGVFNKATSEKSSVSDKIEAWQNINSLFGGMSKILSAPIPSGYAHQGMSGIVKHALSHIPQTLEQLNFAKEIETLSKHPTETDFSAALKRAKATTKEQLKPRESLSIDGNRVDLVDNAGLASTTLQSATEAFHSANKSHPVSAIGGKDVPAATWLVHLDRMLKNKRLSDLTLGETGKMITQLNYAERAHGDSGKFIRPARKQLMAHQEQLLRQEYGNDADKVIEAMRKIKATQKFNIQSSQATELTQGQKMTADNQHGKALTGLEDFSVPQAIAKLGEAEQSLKGTPLEGTVNTAEHAEHVNQSMEGLKRLSQISGKYKEFVKGTEQMSKGSAVSPTGERMSGEQLGASDKYTGLADLYHSASGEGLEGKGKEVLTGSLANGVFTGKPDTKKINTVRQMAINLNDKSRFKTPEEQSSMRKQFTDDLISGIKSDLEKASKVSAEASARGEGGVTARGAAKGTFSKPVDSLNKIIANVEELTSGSGTKELNKILADSDVKELMPGGTVYNIAKGFKNDALLSSELNKISGLKNTQEVTAMSDRIAKLNENLLQTYRNKFKHSALDDLDKVNYKTKAETAQDREASSLMSKIVGIGYLRPILSKLSAGRLSNKEIQANAIADVNGLLSNPFYKDKSGKSYSDIVRDEIAKSDAALANRKKSKGDFKATSAGMRGGMFIGDNLNKR